MAQRGVFNELLRGSPVEEVFNRYECAIGGLGGVLHAVKGGDDVACRNGREAFVLKVVEVHADQTLGDLGG